MSHWNHRVIRREWPQPDGSVEITYAIHEVYYKDDGSIYGVTADPVAPSGEELIELQTTLRRMLWSTEEPVLEWADIPEPGD